MMQKSYWDPNGILDKLSFDQIISRNFTESEEISDWFNAFNHADNGYQPDKLVGLGPYQVDEWVPSQYITIIRKDTWWGKDSESIYDKDKNIFILKKTSINLFNNKKKEFIINSNTSRLSNNKKILELVLK